MATAPAAAGPGQAVPPSVSIKPAVISSLKSVHDVGKHLAKAITDLVPRLHNGDCDWDELLDVGFILVNSNINLGASVLALVQAINSIPRLVALEQASFLERWFTVDYAEPATISMSAAWVIAAVFITCNVGDTLVKYMAGQASFRVQIAESLKFVSAVQMLAIIMMAFALWTSNMILFE